MKRVLLPLLLLFFAFEAFAQQQPTTITSGGSVNGGSAYTAGTTYTFSVLKQ